MLIFMSFGSFFMHILSLLVPISFSPVCLQVNKLTASYADALSPVRTLCISD